MIIQPTLPPRNARLRLVFNDGVLSFPLGDRPSLGDIAGLLCEPSTERHGMPLAIDVAWPRDGGERSGQRNPVWS